MKQSTKFAALLFIYISFASCSNDDPSVVYPTWDSVTINKDGSTSTGAVFTPVNESIFYLDYIKYEIAGTHMEVTGYDPQRIGERVEPYMNIKYNGTIYSTTAITSNAFFGCYSMTSFSIPNSVEKIEDGAFNGCNNLRYVYYNTKDPKPMSVSFPAETYQDGELFLLTGDAIKQAKEIEPWSNFKTIKTKI